MNGGGHRRARAMAALAGGVAGLLALSAAGAWASASWGAGAHRAHESSEAQPLPPSAPRRIVSTNLPCDEVLLALVPPARIAALSRFADDEAVSNVVREARAVHGRVVGEAEPILAQRPDLVLAFPFGQGATQTLLEESGVPLVRVPGATDVVGVARDIRLIGAAVGERERAEALIAKMDRTLEDVRARVRGAPRPRVLFWYPGGFTSGAGTLVDDLLRIAGGRNVAAEAGRRGVAALPLERALALDPAFVFVLDYRADGRGRELGGKLPLTRDPRWQSVRAVRERHVEVLPMNHAYASSQYAALAAVDMARRLHPHRMTKESGDAQRARGR